MEDDQPRLFKTEGVGAGEEVTADVDDDQVRISIRGNRVIALMRNSFIEVDMTWYSHGFINFEICMPSEFCEMGSQVNGHLGNCDGNQPNDVSAANQRK